MQPGERVLIFGASARAAAFSALRAGLTPWCADLFADADLAARCPAVRVSGKYPDDFAAIERDAPPGPLLFTGGLENHPDLIETLSRRRTLWGNNGPALRRSRRPAFLRDAARACGLPAPDLHQPGRALPERQFLVKPLAGTGGHGVSLWTPRSAVSPETHYLQEYVEGVPASALYVAAGGTSRLLGLARQLVGEAWCHAKPFAYCGSVGPITLDVMLAPGLRRLGHRVAAEARLRGLFGIDGILRDEGFWPIEINPRYTASVEVIEYATGLRALDFHRLAFEDEKTALSAPVPMAAPDFVGKAILFAPVSTTFPDAGPWCEAMRTADVPPRFADVPAPGTHFEQGHPLCTLMARAADVETCMDALRAMAAQVSAALGWPDAMADAG